MCLHLGYKIENKWPATLGVGLPAFFLEKFGPSSQAELGLTAFGPFAAKHLNFVIWLAAIELLNIFQAGDEPGHNFIFAILGKNEIVREIDAGMECIAVCIEEKEDVTKCVRRRDRGVVIEHLAGGELEVEEDILAGIVEKVQGSPMAIGGLAGALNVGRGVGISQAARQGR